MRIVEVQGESDTQPLVEVVEVQGESDAQPLVEGL